MGVGLVRSLQPQDILLIYCNNLIKKYITPLLTLLRGALSVPLLMSVSEVFSVPFHTLIKFCYTKEKKNAWRNINSLKYADDTTLKVER